MTEFDELRGEIVKARAAQRAAGDELAAARARLARLDAQLTEARRTTGDVRTLARARKRAASRLDKASAQRLELHGSALEALRRFAERADPRKQVTELAPGVPLLLFPLRLETRFKRVRGIGRIRRDQLWVRVFPDTCLVDTFEPEPSATEVESVRRYWAAVWRAGGAEAGERAAWRNLVASHGAGRGRWLAAHHVPVNDGDRPAAGGVVLVATADDTLLDRAALAAYWEAAWRAGGAGPAEDAALAQLAHALGGDDGLAAALRTSSRPPGFDDPPPEGTTRAEAPLTVAVAVFPEVADAPVASWTRAPHVDLLPDRLLCIVDGGAAGRAEVLGEPIATPLQVGPDPSGQPELKPDGDDLAVPDELQWMVDFDRAVQDGLGFRIDLPEELAATGADNVTVVGLRIADDPAAGAKALEQLLAHHRDGRSGVSLIRQGTPTNNTESDDAGFTRAHDADETFDLLATAELPDADAAARLDGSWLAAWLGIDPAVITRVPGAFGTDQLEARAMNVALWPATLGYFLETMMDPLVGSAGAEDARWFFVNYVSGRGALPALRIGAQPYGVLPAIAFDRLTPRADEEGRAEFLRHMLDMLHAADADWAGLARQVRSLGGQDGDLDADLLDVIGLHPGSAEFHYRYAEGIDHLINVGELHGLAQPLLQALFAAALDAPALRLLRQVAGTGGRPDILDKYFLGAQGGLLGTIVDDRPLSESEPIRAWTAAGDNYIEWLAKTARESLESLRTMSGFIDGRPPAALLYLLLRHALLLGYHDSAVQLRRKTLQEPALKAMKREPPFVHVAGTPSESRWAPLLEKDAAITGDPKRSVADHIARNLGRLAAAARLREQVIALETLAPLPTARLERLLAEHLDTCSYRFDAWRLGYVHHHVEQLRAKTPAGIHLGAYGRLEDVRPSGSVRRPVKLDADLAAVFQRQGDAPLESDSANGGFVHAPSMNHAITAAVLRAGHLSHAGTETLAVNLSTERVRLALSTIEGVRSGQSLGALLGYRLERALHDHGGITEVDRFILPLRKAFPLLADRLVPTRTADDVPAEHAAARNVVDGLRLVEHVDDHPGYPFGKALPAADAAERAVIEAEVDRLRDLHDAIGDLALAEGVHQAAQGRYDAAAAFLDAVGSGAQPPEPEVVRTPASGVTLTHRLALHLDPNAAAPAAATPRATAEPRVDAWLEQVLPDLDDVACAVAWDGGSAEVSLADLGLRPLDVLSVVHADGPAMTELDDRVIAHVLATEDVPLDAVPQIRYLQPVPGHLRVFDVAAHVRTLRSLLRRSRPLRPGDAALPTEASSAAEGDVAVDRARVADPLDALETLRDDLDAHAAALAAVPSDVDEAIATTGALFGRASAYGVPQTGWGFAYAWRREQVVSLRARVAERVAVWDTRLEDFDELLAEFDGMPATAPAPARLSLLQRAEMTVATALSEIPADLDDLRAGLRARRATFVARRDDLADAIATLPDTYSALLAAVADVLPLGDVDLEPFDLQPEQDALGAFGRDLETAVTAVARDVRARATAARTALASADAAATAAEGVAALTTAAQAMLGDEALLVPDAGVSSSQAAEWANALATSRDGTLTAHLRVNGVELPVDEWLTGVARVREQARAFEQTAIAASGFGRAELELTPVQLPFIPGDHWLALPFPDDAVLNRDRLLFTALVPPGFDPSARLCGLLLDEWTEVLPGSAHETGIATHFDRPSSEPPHALLLVSPTSADGAWTWEDVVGALEDTFALARKRAVEPAHLDNTPYTRFLPATVSSTTLRGISIGLAYAVNNGVAAFAKDAVNG